MSVRQLALRWSVGEERVKSLIQTGAITAFTVPASGRFGKAVRISLSAVEEAEQDWSVHPSVAWRKRQWRQKTTIDASLQHFPELIEDGSHDPVHLEDVEY